MGNKNIKGKIPLPPAKKYKIDSESLYILPSITYVNGKERGLMLMYVIKCAASVLPVNLTVASLTCQLKPIMEMLKITS